MNRQSGKFLTILLCAAIVGITACSTTTQRLGPSEAAMNNYGIGKGDTVLIRYANKDDPRSSNRSNLVQITEITGVGISGVAENGSAVNVGYDEIFQIEVRKKSSAIKSDNPVLMGASKAVKSAVTVVPVAACIALALHGVSCS